MKKLSYFAVLFIFLIGFNSAMAQPTPLTPTDGENGVSLTPTLTWTNTGTLYSVDIDDNSDFSSPVLSATNVSPNSYAIPPTFLSNYTTYYWRIRETFPVPSGWSTTFHFNTLPTAAPAAFTLLTPADGTNPFNIYPANFTWNASTEVDLYTVEVSDDDFVTINFSTTSTTNSATINGINPTTAYKWRVNATNSLGTTTTPAFGFTSAALPAPEIPVLGGIANNTVGVTLTPTFTWTNGSGTPVTSYTIQITTDPSLTNFTYDEVVLTNSFTVPAPLLRNTIYYWRVSATNASGTSPFASTWKFTTTPANTPILSAPANNTTIYSPTAGLSWFINGVTTGLKWQVEFREIGDPLVGTPTHSTLEGVYNLDIPDLVGSTSYHWSVRAHDDRSGTDVYSDWSAPYQFLVHVSVGAAPVPVVAWPKNNAQIYTITPTLTWFTNSFASGTLTWDIEIQPSAVPFTGVPTYTGLNTKSYIIPGVDALTPGTEYHWQVRTVNNLPIPAIQSAWSVEGVFTIFAGLAVTPVQPVISWPKGGASVYTNTPTLRWYLNAYANPGLDYEIELVLGNIGDLTGVPNIPAGTNVFSFTTAPLLKGVTYSWQVRSIVGGVPSAWSTPQSFIVLFGGGTGLPVPICSWPINNAPVYGNKTQLNWYLNAPYAGLDYEVELVMGGIGDLTGVPSFPPIGVAIFNLTIPVLYSGNQYSWQVRAIDGLQTSGWSIPATFQTYPGAGIGPDIPIPSWPIGGTTVNTNKPILNWYMNSLITGIVFDMRYSRYPDMSNSTVFTDLTTTSFDFDTYVPAPAPLVTGTQYYWQVRAKDNFGILSAWSAIATFTTLASNMPVAPVFGTPYGIELSASNINFSWYLPTLPSTNLTYEFEVADNPDMSNPLVVSGIASSDIVLNTLVNNKTYYWRVRSKDGSGNYSAFSPEAKFTTLGATSVDEINTEVPQSFFVDNNYPNPFNPTTNIRFGLSTSSFVSVKIYDILGREVRTLIAQDMDEGVHTIVWDGKDSYGSMVTSGTYICRVASGSNAKSIKLMFMK